MQQINRSKMPENSRLTKTEELTALVTFQKDFTDYSDVILFGLYSNPLTCAARLFSSPLDKNKPQRLGDYVNV